MNKLWAIVVFCIVPFNWKTYGNGVKTRLGKILSIRKSSKGIKHTKKDFAFFLFQIKKELKHKKTKNWYRRKFVRTHHDKETEEKHSEEVKKKRIKQRKEINQFSTNKYLSQNISGISVFPLKQKNGENQLKTQLPAKEFKPKKSLGQNYLKDFNVIKKIVEAVELKIEEEKTSAAPEKKNKKIDRDKKEVKKINKSEKNNEYIDGNNVKNGEREEIRKSIELESILNGGRGVIELGCGLGQLTKFLYKKYPNMTGIEIDERALSIISRTIPNLDFIHDDVLQVNYKELSINKNTKLTVVGNLPFYITSQILFCLLDFSTYIEQAIVTIQYEVGKRIVAKPNTKEYSILTILFHIYTHAFLLFKIPSKAFYPAPKVEAAVMKILFKQRKTWNCNLLYLKQILKSAFQQKRKMLKTSLKQLIQKSYTKQIPPQFADCRPQQLLPYDFVDLANSLFPPDIFPFNPIQNPKIWRKEKHGE